MVKKTFVIKALALTATLFIFSPAEAAKKIPKPFKAYGDGTVSLYRADKNERGTFAYRKKNGTFDSKELEKIAHFFRCRLTEEVHPIDPELISIIDAISDRFGGKEVEVVSGYRSPTRNALMRRKSRRVAKRSLHMQGAAADIVIKGVPPANLRNFAYSLGRGGVGYYGKRTFVHVDTGPLRAWGWKPPVNRRTAAAVK
ncbi:MAG TPA: DUF882 domain-containing protein [bacterium]|nr:DUF882 domain-containing protein [bacterium]